ncbi:mechanosensitive ion channel family protein [bacterium]|nr:mechanosensitive ion channel family protein [bacterium]
MEQYLMAKTAGLVSHNAIKSILYTILNFVIYCFLMWLGLTLIDKFIDKITAALKKRDTESLLLRFMPLLRKTAKIAFGLVFTVAVLQLYGFSVSTLVAGIGVGGVVFGLAAQKTIINIFGSVSLIIDNAYKVGDYICVSYSLDGKDVEGYVEDITLRSTKIRSLEGTMYNVPNGNISEGVVKNYTQMKKRLFKEKINLTYSTTTEKIEQAKAICVEVLTSHPEVLGNYNVNLCSLSSYSVDIQILADMKPMGLAQLYKVKNDILMDIFKRFNENGIDFAFPTQTIELKQ